MIIVSDCLTEQPAEGCLKIANSLIKRIKDWKPQTTVISYGKISTLSDRHLQLNKLFLNWNFLSLIRRKKETVLYIPNASCTMASAVRIWIMSQISRCPIKAIFVQWHGLNRITKYLLKQSDVQVVCLSKDSAERYTAAGINAVYMKTGVDLQRYKPVSVQKKMELREKYHISNQEKVILHVGHLKEGRNLDKLGLLDEEFHIVVVVSSVTAAEDRIREILKKHKNITIVDAYFFPVLTSENCIDVPLSVLEAAACGIPILATPYGELKEFSDLPGFRFIKDFNAEEINDILNALISEHGGCKNRESIQLYDWRNAVERLLEEQIYDNP